MQRLSALQRTPPPRPYGHLALIVQPEIPEIFVNLKILENPGKLEHLEHLENPGE